MKTFVLTFVSILLYVISTQASTTNDENFNRNYNGKSFIFVEGDVEFSIFPDGQFDFVYLGNQGSQITINTPNVAVNFNSGYNYDAYVQYDNYGAVIQIEDVPVYYDEYGRISQAGSVTIQYNDRRVVQVGGLYVHYNPYGYYSHYTGYINPWNRYYVYRPWHAYYTIPYYSYCVVYATPYRSFYSPIRYSYSHHKNHYNRGGYAYTNGRRDFYRPGSRVHYKDGRVAINNDYRPSNTRGNANNIATTYRRDDNVARSNFTTRKENGVQRGAPVNANVSRNESIKRGAPANANVSRNASTQRGAPANANVSRNESTQRGAPASAHVSRNASTQRGAPASAHVSRNESTQRGAPANTNISKKETARRSVQTNTNVNKNVTAQRNASSSNNTRQTNQVRSSSKTKNNNATRTINTRGNSNSSSIRGGRG